MPEPADRRGEQETHNGGMESEFLVQCPYCGETVEIYLEPDVRGSFVQDCEVCCNPWQVHVSGHGDERTVQITRNDD
jgi:hypothetical protein